MAPTAAASDEAPLDREIADLKAQAAALRKALRIQCSTILSAASTQSSVQSAEPRSRLGARAAQQHAYTQQCIYRTSTPVTAFKVRDPDPNAVDDGHVLGLRFEAMSRGRFLPPYYVMLNRPFPGARHLRVHRHTVPPAVPLPGLAARHLPPPGPDARDLPRQDLDAFARALRREITRYHNRLGVSADLRRRLGLHQRTGATLSRSSIVEISIADIEAKQVKLTWADDRTGRLVMDDDGNILKFVVFGPNGRDWETTKELFGRNLRIEDIAKTLEEHGAAG